MKGLASLAALSCAAQVAWAADPLVGELEQRLAAGGAEQVNAYLDAHWPEAMLPFSQKTAACDLQAVSVAMQLSRASSGRVARAHGDALRTATGRCMAFVLALAPLHEMARYCSAVADWGAAQTARELRRRIALIEADAVLRGSPRGQSCLAAYRAEMRNTRVGLRIGT